MLQLLDLQKRLLPDLLDIMQKRYHILKTIHILQPVGRRTLAQTLGFTERVLRSEVEFLKEQNLIDIKTTGMSLTTEGVNILEKLEGMMREVSGINEMEKQLKLRFGVKEVVIVDGNSDETPWVKEELGRACIESMKKRLAEKNIIAVTGGTTMAAVAEQLTPDFLKGELLFVPARGGIGEDVKNQANTICAKMAEHTGASHKVLYVPDQVSKEVYESFIKEPAIKEVLHLITSANMVLHGIGDAITMANRRKTSPEDLDKIKKSGAVGEAFGYYFDEDGEVVHRVQTVGIQLKDLDRVEHVFAVAGGSSKAKAIQAYMKRAPRSTILITDEGAARELLKMKNSK
jgi:central glycolytic genes regulator